MKDIKTVIIDRIRIHTSIGYTQPRKFTKKYLQNLT
jgi:hypothetical protein